MRLGERESACSVAKGRALSEKICRKRPSHACIPTIPAVWDDDCLPQYSQLAPGSWLAIPGMDRSGVDRRFPRPAPRSVPDPCPDLSRACVWNRARTCLVPVPGPGPGPGPGLVTGGLDRQRLEWTGGQSYYCLDLQLRVRRVAEIERI